MNQREKTSSGINIITSLADTIDWITDSFVNCSLPLPKASWLHKKNLQGVCFHMTAMTTSLFLFHFILPHLYKKIKLGITMSLKIRESLWNHLLLQAFALVLCAQSVHFSLF